MSSLSITGCGSTNNKDFVRIHIRANSNESVDQNIKLVVRDAVVDYITPLIVDCTNSHDVIRILDDNLDIIEKIADGVLLNGGFEYRSHAKITNEYFPTREYGKYIFPADYYDALIVNLGSGNGNNWWCVAYPPLCFVGNDVGGNQVKYKSKIMELINKFFGR